MTSAFLGVFMYSQAQTVIDGIKYNFIGEEAQVVGAEAGVTSLDIPASVEADGTVYTVTSIGDYAFQGNNELVSVKFPNTLTSMGYSAFSACKSISGPIVIPASVVLMQLWALRELASCQEFIVDEKNPVYQSIDGVIYSKGLDSLVFCPEGKSGALIIPEGVQMITDASCHSCYNLTSISLPSTVKTFESFCFYNCTGLTDIYSHSENPVKFSPYTFGSNLNYGAVNLHVKAGFKEVYTEAGWGKFNIVEDLVSSVDQAQNNLVMVEVLPDGIKVSADQWAIYDLSGVMKASGTGSQIIKLVDGVYIVSTRTKTVKVCVE